jgi:hypothetical protein
MPAFFLLLTLLLTSWLPGPAYAQSITGAAVYTPQQLHELLVGQMEPVVIATFGRMPDLVRGHNWFYERMAIYLPEQNQYYTLAVVCFSQADGRVWQVVCYPH